MPIQSIPDPPDRYHVIVWLPHGRDPYRLARGLARSIALSYREALALADTWARALSGDRRIVIEVIRCD